MNGIILIIVLLFLASFVQYFKEQIMETDYNKWSIIFLIAMAVLGQVYGIYKAIKHWNDKEKDNVDIFYWLFIYWFLAIWIGILSVPALIIGIPAYVLTKMRD